MSISRACSACGAPAPRKLSRGMCDPCYGKYVREHKRAGDFVPVNPNCRKPRPLIDRVLERTAAGHGGCVVWTGHVNPDGYGTIKDSASYASRMAHRVAYELLVGPIPDGLQLDHLCRNTRCINPHHLEPVTCAENLRRAPGSWAVRFGDRTLCDRGHPFTPENTYVGTRRKGRRIVQFRVCRECKNAYYRAKNAARRDQGERH